MVLHSVHCFLQVIKKPPTNNVVIIMRTIDKVQATRNRICRIYKRSNAGDVNVVLLLIFLKLYRWSNVPMTVSVKNNIQPHAGDKHIGHEVSQEARSIHITTAHSKVGYKSPCRLQKTTHETTHRSISIKCSCY